LINCLVSFVASVHSALSLRALDHLHRCAGHLADGTIEPALTLRTAQNTVTVPFTNTLSDSTPGDLEVDSERAQNSSSDVSPVRIDEDASVFRLWWPLLLGLSTRVADPRALVRERALSTLTSVLRTYGSIFSSQTWVVIFKGILFPMIDNAKTDIIWIESMCSHVLSVCIEMLCMLRDTNTLSPTLLPDLISIIESCVCQENEVLARHGIKAWNDLLTALKTKMDGETLSLICDRLLRCVLSNLCRDFGEAGKLTVHVSPLKGSENVPQWLNQLVIPQNMITLLIDSPCPIACRRGDTERSLSISEDFTAPASASKPKVSAATADSTPRAEGSGNGRVARELGLPEVRTYASLDTVLTRHVSYHLSDKNFHDTHFHENSSLHH
jgi:hypothetical protein